MSRSHKLSPTLTIIAAMMLFFIQGKLLAQTSSISPYSRFGIGDIVPEGFSIQSGMGGIGAAYFSSTNINFIKNKH